MSRFKMVSSILILISITITFAGGIGMESAYGQVTDSAFPNCVMMSGGYTVDVVMLGTDEDCDDEQFAQAVNHYKAEGYTERQYSNMFGEQMMSLEK